jgi:hypothetical protein
MGYMHDIPHGWTAGVLGILFAILSAIFAQKHRYSMHWGCRAVAWVLFNPLVTPDAALELANLP